MAKQDSRTATKKDRKTTKKDRTSRYGDTLALLSGEEHYDQEDSLSKTKAHKIKKEGRTSGISKVQHMKKIKNIKREAERLLDEKAHSKGKNKTKSKTAKPVIEASEKKPAKKLSVRGKADLKKAKTENYTLLSSRMGKDVVDAIVHSFGVLRSSPSSWKLICLFQQKYIEAIMGNLEAQFPIGGNWTKKTVTEKMMDEAISKVKLSDIKLNLESYQEDLMIKRNDIDRIRSLNTFFNPGYEGIASV